MLKFSLFLLLSTACTIPDPDSISQCVLPADGDERCICGGASTLPGEDCCLDNCDAEPDLTSCTTLCVSEE